MTSKIQAAWARVVKMSRIQKVGFSLLLIALTIGLLGYLNQHKGLYLGELAGNLFQDFYANVSAELASIAITVLIIDAIYQRRDIERERRDLILQMGSPDNAFAREAVRRLRVQGWLKDGTLRSAQLSEANLCTARLNGADLSGANLSGANLSGANLSEANLHGANLSGANLSEASLHGANLSGAELLLADLSRAHLGKADLSQAYLNRANLSGAHLEEADLSGTYLHRANLFRARVTNEQLARTKALEGAIMPDGTKRLEEE